MASAAAGPSPADGRGELAASTTHAAAAAAAAGQQQLTTLEQEVLDEYARLVGNLNDLSSLLAELSERPSAQIVDGLRGLERRMAPVFTLLKASVYSIVLQQQYLGDAGDGADDETVGVAHGGE